MHYQDFELEISRNGTDAGYIAKVRSSQGEAQQSFSLPDAVTLENLILKMRGFSRSSRAANCPEVQAASRFGELLFSNAFGGEISNLLKSCLDQTNSDKGLRIKLILQDAPELSALPWEFLYLPSRRDFLAHSPATPIVRYLKHATAIKPLAVTLPLKLLVVMASPTDKAPLDIKAEREALEQALTDLVAEGTLQITWLEHATVAALADALEQDVFHLLHFIGHSYFDDKLSEGALILENAAGKSHYYDASRLKVLLKDHATLRLVVLNSCEGAMSDEKDPFSSIATTLMLAGIPAVIAMQFEISDAAAISFAKIFYKWLAKGMAIDEAMGRARKHLFAVEENNVEWGTPVLYLRAKDGVLFTVDTSKQDALAEKLALEKFQQEQARLEQLRLEQEKLAMEKRERERLALEKADQDRIAQEKAALEKQQKEEQARQKRLEREKFVKDLLAKGKTWGKYVLIAAAVVGVGYGGLNYGLSAYQDYKERQAVEASKQAVAQAKAEAERKAAEAIAAENKRKADELAALAEQKKQQAIQAEKDRLAAIAAENQRKADEQAALEEQQRQEAENLRLKAEQWVKDGEDYLRKKSYKRACEKFKQAADAGNADGKEYFDRIKKCR